jgi:hypothetical protein
MMKIKKKEVAVSSTLIKGSIISCTKVAAKAHQISLAYNTFT